VTATRPPLYHILLQIPKTDVELEKFLNVNIAENFARNRLKRGGFDKSGVSTGNNRLVERHASRDGYYWKSYDFKQGNPKARLTHLPLGPRLPNQAQFENFAFVHDGGEQIFSLPNGLQGYMLIDGQGKRIDEGPTDVVRDLTETAGKVAVVNGISCMHCHKHGMIDFVDTIRTGAGVFGHAREKVQDLYPPQDEMAKLIARDRERFLRAIDEATGKFLKVGEDADKPIEQFAEPIGAIARFHFRDLGLHEAAFELGIKDPAELVAGVKFNPLLQRLGLKPLTLDQGLDRGVWESQDAVTSPFQETARILDRGTPLVFQ
jgi:serine/threonine-protein kinase